MRSCIPVAKVTSGAIKCSPTDFPEPGLSLHQPWAHVVLHLHCQPYTEARGREGPGRAGAGHVGCAAAILRGGVAAPTRRCRWARDPRALGWTPGLHKRPDRALVSSRPNPPAPSLACS